MMPFDAFEVIGRERREALAAEAENHRLARPARIRARWALVSRMSSLASSIRRPGRRFQRRPADCYVVAHPARRAT